MRKKKKKKSSSKTTVATFGLREPKDQKKGILSSAPALALSAVGGAFAGAAMGKPSFYSGLVTTIIGGVARVPIVTNFGIGMMICGGYQTVSLNGRGLNGAKDRIRAFTEDFKQRMYLDKVLKPKTPAIEGLGNVQYFRYPGNQELDMSALDKIQGEIELSAKQFQQGRLNGVSDYQLMEERNY